MAYTLERIKNMTEVKTRIDLLKLLPPNAVAAELGVAESLFSRDLLSSGKLSKLYLVDNWGYIPDTRGDGNFPQEWHDKNYAAAFERMKPFGDRAIFLKGMTLDMANQVPDNSLDFLYHDAAHDYVSVLRDLGAWWHKVKVGGIFSFHDYANEDYGVTKAVHDFCGTEFPIVVIPEDEGISKGAYFIKTRE